MVYDFVTQLFHIAWLFLVFIRQLLSQSYRISVKFPCETSNGRALLVIVIVYCSFLTIPHVSSFFLTLNSLCTLRTFVNARLFLTVTQVDVYHVFLLIFLFSPLIEVPIHFLQIIITFACKKVYLH